METWGTLFDRGAEWGTTEAGVRAALATHREDGVGDAGGEDVRTEGEGEGVAGDDAEGDGDA